jgi:hypothetical protein
VGTLKGICKWIIPVCEVVGMQVEQWWVCCRVNVYLEYSGLDKSGYVGGVNANVEYSKWSPGVNAGE